MQYLSAPRSADVRNSGKGHTLSFVMALLCLRFNPNGANAQFLQKASSKFDVSLTCTFSEDTGEKNRGIQIFDAQKVNALLCQWREEKFFCSVGGNYTSYWTVSGSVAVRKLSSREPESRTCFCYLVDRNYTVYERPCAVTVTIQEINKTTLEATSRHREHSHSRDFSTEPSEGGLFRHFTVSLLLFAKFLLCFVRRFFVLRFLHRQVQRFILRIAVTFISRRHACITNTPQPSSPHLSSHQDHRPQCHQPEHARGLCHLTREISRVFCAHANVVTLTFVVGVNIFTTQH